MAFWPAGLMTIAIMIAGSFTVGFGDSMKRVRRDDSSESVVRVQSVHLCPCSQGCCDKNWYQYKDACYLPMNVPKYWQQAKQNCEDLNAHLASVHSEEEDSFIFYLMEEKQGYWLGAEKTDDTAAPWKWTDNSAWDYSDELSPMVDQQFDHLIVNKMGDGGKIFWVASRQNFARTYVCKYLLD